MIIVAVLISQKQACYVNWYLQLELMTQSEHLEPTANTMLIQICY